MIVHARGFDKAEFPQWIKAWFVATDIPIDKLVEAPVDAILGRCVEADYIHRLLKQSGGDPSD